MNSKDMEATLLEKSTRLLDEYSAEEISSPNFPEPDVLAELKTLVILINLSKKVHQLE